MKDNEEVQELQSIIEGLVTSKKLTYLDALMYHCDRTGLEVEVAAKMLSKTLKKKIKEDAIRLNLIKAPKSGKLPI